MSALLTPDHTVAVEHLGAVVFLARFDIHIHVYQSQEAHSVTFIPHSIGRQPIYSKPEYHLIDF